MITRPEYAKHVALGAVDGIGLGILADAGIYLRAIQTPNLTPLSPLHAAMLMGFAPLCLATVGSIAGVGNARFEAQGKVKNWENHLWGSLAVGAEASLLAASGSSIVKLVSEHQGNFGSNIMNVILPLGIAGLAGGLTYHLGRNGHLKKVL